MRRLAVVLLLVVVPVVLLAAPAGAEAPEATGWWSRTSLGPVVPADLPSGVPDGGLYVAGDPTGPLGVSALRLTVGDRPVGDLVLELADVQGTPAVRACPTSITWLDEQGGPLASAPAAACDRGEAVGEAADGTVRIAVGSLVVDGVLNVVLEPVPGSVFRATFQAPGDQSVTVDDGGSGAFDAIVDPLGSAPFMAPAPVGELAPLPAVVAPAPAPAPAAVPPVAAVTPRLAEQVAGSVEGNRPEWLAACVLFDLALGWFLLARRRAEPAAAAGVGRFARPRTGPVPRL